MKRAISIVILTLFCSIGFGQIVSENPNFVLVDSVDLSKEKLYAKTKYFIADMWNSANNVIQLDDEKSGIIMVKGKEDVSISQMNGAYHYIFNYTIVFRMKDKKFKIEIKDIGNNDSYWRNGKIGKLYLSYNTIENCPSAWKTNAPKSKVVENMKRLNLLFESILTSYLSSLKNNDLNTIDDF